MKPNIKAVDVVGFAEALLGERVIKHRSPDEGADHLVVELTLADGRILIVKVGSDADTDGFVLKKLKSKRLKVPTILKQSLLKAGNVCYPLIVMAAYEGVTLKSVAVSDKHHYVAQIINEVREIHKILSPGGTGRVLEVERGQELPWSDYLLRDLTGASPEFDWDNIVTLPNVDKHLVTSGLQKAISGAKSIPNDRKMRLLHGDLNDSNIFVKGMELEGIIDWSDSLYGDPLFDFARFRMNISHRMNRDALTKYYETLNLDIGEKKLEELYFLIHVLVYVNWYSLCGDTKMVEKQMTTLSKVLN